MSIESFMVSPVTILYPGTTTNRYGDEVEDWSNPTEFHTKAWLVQQNTSEPGQATRANEVVTDWIMACRGSVEISSRDRVLYQGTTFMVIGDPRNARTIVNPNHHKEVTLRIVKG